MNTQDKLFEFLKKKEWDINRKSLDEWEAKKTDEENIEWKITIVRK